MKAAMKVKEKALKAQTVFKELIQPGQLVGDVYSINYSNALIQIHDKYRKTVGGVSALSLLFATRINTENPVDPNLEESNIILLRVLDSHPLPNSAEAERIRVEVAQYVAGEAQTNWNDREAMDALTANLLSFAGLNCRIIGTFYLTEAGENGDLNLCFGGDIPNFYPNCGLKVYKPTGSALEKVINFRENSSSVKSSGDVKVGNVRFASTDRNFANNLPVSVNLQTSNLLAQKTALFGITRSGKSNTTKVIAKAIFDMRYGKTNAQRVGQLIYDANGEYANENVQDASGKRIKAAIKNLRDAHPKANSEDVITYGVMKHPSDPGRKLMLLNFFSEDNLQVGKEIIDNALEDDNSKFIKNFRQVYFEKPDLKDYSALVRYKRHALCYRALLAKAGFQPPGYLRADPGKLFGKDFVEALEKSSGSRAADHQQAARLLKTTSLSWSQIAQICEYIADFISDRSSGYILFEAFYSSRSSSGETWADDTLKKILEMFRFPNGSRQIGKLVPQHTHLFDGDYAAEIYKNLVQGKLVIIDQSSGNEEINKLNASRLMRYIFRQNQHEFRNGNTPPDILIYLEEAHNILPAGSETDLQNIWVRTAKEGGKYRLGLVYATQEISSIQKNILKNTANFFVAHLNNTDETRELCKYYDFGDFESSILKAQDKGFLRVKTLSNLFVIPVQIDLFEV